MKSKIVVIALISNLFMSFIPVNAKQETVKESPDRPLKNKVLDIVDGMPGAMDGTTIARLIHIIKETEVMLYGTKDERNQRFGTYTFDNKLHSIHSLARLERSKTIKNDQLLRNDLQTILVTIKKDFMEVMEPFIEQARGAKEVTLVLMQEWAEHHKRTDSFLLSWGKQPENSEFDVFYAEVNTFTMLEQFCKDLISFLDDMINSCPRGCHQYAQLRTRFHKN